MSGHRTCPHCRAIVQSAICAICGKSVIEEVVETPPAPRQKWWQKLDPKETKRQALVLGGLVILVGAAVYIITRQDPPPNANALPAPVETSTSTTSTTPGRPPTLDGGSSGGGDGVTGIAPGIDRDVGVGGSPWDEVPPVNFVTGRHLVPDLDFTADIARVAEVLAAFPETLRLEPLDRTEIMTFGGPVDIVETETSQPFAARTVSSGLGPLGQVWIIASSGTRDGDAYLAAARSRWDPARAIEQYAPEPGLRMWKLGQDDQTQVWVTDLDDAAIVVLQAPVAVDPEALRTIIVAWQANLH